MKVLLVNGSPHKSGCTNRALEEVAATLQKEGSETEMFWIGNKPIGGCIACKRCVQTGKCVFDDVVNTCREKAYKADGFVFGTPVHYGAASGNMTAFMDRLFYSELGGNQNKAFYLKPAAAVISARRAGTTAAFDQMNKYFTIQEMPVASSRYWNMVHGAVPEQVEEDLEGLYTMRVLGRNMAYLLKCQEAAKKAGVALPEREPAIFTNFVR
jgi:multimeric flavodoxin WrbA